MHVMFLFVLLLCSQDKESSIPHEELGRNITTVQVLQRKHEIFERELTALGSKVHIVSSMAVHRKTVFESSFE